MTIYKVEFIAQGQCVKEGFWNTKLESENAASAWMRKAPYTRAVKKDSFMPPQNQKELAALLNKVARSIRGENV